MCWMLARNEKGELEIPKAVLYISLPSGWRLQRGFQRCQYDAWASRWRFKLIGSKKEERVRKSLSVLSISLRRAKRLQGSL